MPSKEQLRRAACGTNGRKTAEGAEMITSDGVSGKLDQI